MGPAFVAVFRAGMFCWLLVAAACARHNAPLQLATLPAGMQVEIIGLGFDDAQKTSESQWLGVTCTVQEAALRNQLYRGYFACSSSEESIFFNAVTLRAVAASKGNAGGERMRGFGKTIPPWTRIVVRGFGKNDGYRLHDGVIGEQCVTLDVMTRSTDGTYTGQAICGMQTRLFTAVSLSPSDLGASIFPSKVPTLDANWKETRPSINAPTVVQIVGLHDDDGLKSEEKSHKGRVCMVQGSMTLINEGYYAGSLACKGQPSAVYYMVRVRVLN